MNACMHADFLVPKLMYPQRVKQFSGDMAYKKPRSIVTKNLGVGVWILDRLGLFNYHPAKSYRIYVAMLTFICYAAYHMSRKPISVVANVLAPNCSHKVTGPNDNGTATIENVTGVLGFDPWKYEKGWPPFNGTHCKTLIGAVDYSWLFTYAIFMILSGVIADRVNIRYFLTLGMFGSGVFVGLLGVAYYAEIHHIAYFIVVQIFVGVFESTGWPGVVAVMGNWFGKKNRGLFLGIWNAHTSIGNILGTVVPSVWAVPGQPWAWSFIVPAFIMMLVGIVMFLFLVVDPLHVGLPPPKHHLEENLKSLDKGCDHDTSSYLGPVEDTEHETSLSKNHFMSKDKNASDTGKVAESSMNRKNYSTAEKTEKKKTAISLLQAFKIPGVVEYSIALFFAKLVAYTFLFWLPYYIAFHPISGRYIGELKADMMATLYDVGGIIGGITTGVVSDFLNARAISSAIMMFLAVPSLFFYRSFGHTSLILSAVLTVLCGLFINGPYALITTAVSNDLGTHKMLNGNERATATVGAIIDGFGSLGAATGPLITGWVADDFGWDHAFYVLMTSCFLSTLMLTRLVIGELKYFYLKLKKMTSEDHQSLLPATS